MLLEFSDELVEGLLNAVLPIAALVSRDVALLLPLPDCVVVWKVQLRLVVGTGVSDVSVQVVPLMDKVAVVMIAVCLSG